MFNKLIALQPLATKNYNQRFFFTNIHCGGGYLSKDNIDDKKENMMKNLKKYYFHLVTYKF